MVYTDGSVYVGGWKDFKFHGHGKLVQEGGVVFEGEWVEGRMDGAGSVEASRHNDKAVADGDAKQADNVDVGLSEGGERK